MKVSRELTKATARNRAKANKIDRIMNPRPPVTRSRKKGGSGGNSITGQKPEVTTGSENPISNP